MCPATKSTSAKCQLRESNDTRDSPSIMILFRVVILVFALLDGSETRKARASRVFLSWVATSLKIDVIPFCCLRSLVAKIYLGRTPAEQSRATVKAARLCAIEYVCLLSRAVEHGHIRRLRVRDEYSMSERVRMESVRKYRFGVCHRGAQLVGCAINNRDVAGQEICNV